MTGVRLSKYSFAVTSVVAPLRRFLLSLICRFRPDRIQRRLLAGSKTYHSLVNKLRPVAHEAIKISFESALQRFTIQPLIMGFTQ
jgi:hypothetical protein